MIVRGLRSSQSAKTKGLSRREVGWLGRRSKNLQSFQRQPPRILGQLVEYARRERGLTMETLARQANIDLVELVEIERNPKAIPEPRTVHQLAGVLRLPAEKLMVLAGLSTPEDESLTEAAIRFAARSEASARLSTAERENLEEFVKVLSADGGG